MERISDIHTAITFEANDFDKTQLFEKIKSWFKFFGSLSKKGRLGYDLIACLSICIFIEN